MPQSSVSNGGKAAAITYLDLYGRARLQEQLGRELRSIYATDDVAPLPDLIRIALERLKLVLVARDQRVELEFRQNLTGAAPNLRAFGISLTHDPDRADDLVQETLMRAWNKRERFQPGTNLHAWLFTILRNAFFSEQRKRKREVQDPDGSHAARLTTAPDQTDRLHLQDVWTAFRRLNAEQQQALLLVALEGHSYEQAAANCKCAVGTVKSRVNRARIRLAKLLEHADGNLADKLMQAVLASQSPQNLLR